LSEHGQALSRQEKAKIILEMLDTYAPASVNWNFEKEWISAIEKGLDVIAKKEKSN
jgi:hypothetical protein